MKKLVLSLLLTACLSVGVTGESKGKVIETKNELHPYAVKMPEGWRYGYILPHTGKWIIPPSFEEAQPFGENGLAVIRQAGKLGLINKQGNFVVKPAYQMISPFQDGMAMVQTEDDWGFVTDHGRFINMPPAVSSAQLFKEGFAGIEIDGQWGFLNSEGQIAIAAEYDSVHEFNQGLAAVVKAGKWGYVNKDRQTVMKPELDNKPEFYGGYAAAACNGKWGYVSQAGNWAVEPRFEAALAFFDGLAAVKENGKWGFIDATGALVIGPQYDGAASFESGLAPVKINQHWGYIDKQGQVVIMPQFDRVTVFAGDLAPFLLNGLWGFINRSGEMVLQPQYEDVRFWGPQPEEKGQGLFWVSVAGKAGLLDSNGKLLLPLVFDEIKQLRFQEPKLEYIAVYQNQAYGILNMQGQWIIQPSLWRLPDTVYLAAKVAVIAGDFYGSDGKQIPNHYGNLLADGCRFGLNRQYEEANRAFAAAAQINPQDQAVNWAQEELRRQQ